MHKALPRRAARHEREGGKVRLEDKGEERNRRMNRRNSRCAVIDVSLASRLALAPARVNYSHKRGLNDKSINN